ncbi:uncharacterized protein LOC119975947 isoform X1 [Scyliorhinus canicula]|uniref:uncharacterized protein LOC119975947 isoform X1 n=1 Tax=Scyliorhinus canicula TaxID=7830 RepID=UPI0018F4CA19|nr:uncharacterized protein LOC119975947 isoform X1 [Scyliorhinus canicula]
MEGGRAELDPDWTEREFQQLVKAIGGRESIFLIGEVCESRDLMFQFINNLFPCSAKLHSKLSDSGSSQQTAEPQCKEPDNEREFETLLDSPSKVTHTLNGTKEQRRIKARLILFLFHQDFICNKRNDLVIRELLKDVRHRSSSWEDLPALIGVVHADTVTGELSVAVRLIEYYLRAVFHRHPGECVQALPFIANQPDSMTQLKKTTCVVIRAVSSITTDVRKRRGICFPGIPCFFRNTRRRIEDRQVNNIRNCIEQEGISKNAGTDAVSQQLTVGPSTVDGFKTDLQIDSGGNNGMNMETEV